MEVKQIPLAQIVPYERNAKKHPEEQVRQIANSIREFGWQQPLVLDKDNVVVIGHGRLLAAEYLGLEEVPVVYAEGLSETQIKALRLADNKLNESGWDFDLLDRELDELSDIDMTEFGFMNINDIDIESFFDEKPLSGMEKEKQAQKIQCPHCGEWFEV